MAKFRKRPVVVDATQWFPGVVVPGVEQVDPHIVFSADGKHFYLSALGGPKLANMWLQTDGGGDDKPFAFYDVKSGETRIAVEDDPLVKRYLQYQGLAELPKAYGLIETLEGRMAAMPGDWIITGVQNEKYPCKPDIFEQTYERVV